MDAFGFESSHGLSNSFHSFDKHLLSSYCMPGAGIPAAYRTGASDALRFPVLPGETSALPFTHGVTLR